MPDKLRVRLRKSPISYTAKARGTVRALGLHRMHETVEVPDNPATRGMVRAVRFLVEVEQVPEAKPTSDAAPRPARRRSPAAGAAAPASAAAAPATIADAAAPASAAAAPATIADAAPTAPAEATPEEERA
jgi:large subunit ribosomal protein L30